MNAEDPRRRITSLLRSLLLGSMERYMKKIATLLCVAVGLQGSNVLAQTASTLAHSKGATGRLEGTWAVTITPPMANVPPHIGFISFVRDGVVLGSPEPSLPPYVAPIVRTVHLQGTWERAGSEEFVWTMSSLGYDVMGAPVGYLKVSGRLRLTDKDTFEGTASIAACDLNLACGPYTPAPARNSGSRLKVE
jgi:hypothetical protein